MNWFCLIVSVELLNSGSTDGLRVCLQELKLPFTFLSGHIHELRIHVPWTKLSTEPVVITINTMECILKLRDGATVSV